MSTDTLTPGTRVAFREGTPPYAKNAGIVYVVAEEARMDNTHSDGPRPYVWLVHSEDVDKPRSRQRARNGYVSALEVVA